MLIDGVNNAGAQPVLAAVMTFSARRQEVIAHNIANVGTPNFQHRDVSVPKFQGALREAIEDRRNDTGGQFGKLELRETDEVTPLKNGGLRLNPTTPAGGVLFHDRNDRDIERLMQDLVENVGAFRTATELMSQQGGMLRAAMAERVG